MGLLEFATENEKKGQSYGFSARLVRGWLKLRADHLERQLLGRYRFRRITEKCGGGSKKRSRK